MADDSAPPVEGATVLVVDDDRAIRDVLTDVLQDEGYHTLLASDGREAIAHLQPGRHLPDVVLLDLLMPEVDGYGVLEHLRRNLLQELPVLIFSAQKPDASIFRALDAELRDFVAKPFDLDELLIRMQRLLHRSPRFASSGSGALRIYALGSLRVYRDEMLLFDEGWRNKPAKTIFKLLFTGRGRRFPKDVLAEILWPESDPDAAANRLRVAVHELRKMLTDRGVAKKLPSYIAQQEGAYYFDTTLDHWTDVDAFELQIRRARESLDHGEEEEALASFQAAEALYQGDYLRDDPFFEWSTASRERLREEHLSMLAQVAEIYAARGEPAEAAAFCRKILRLEPWREEVYRHLMQYLAAAGRPAEALRVYEECRRAMQAEVEAEPSPETRQVRDHIASRGAVK